MTIKEQVFEVLHRSPHCMFAEDVYHQLPTLKLSTVRSSCFDLAKEGRVSMKRKDRPDGRVQAVFYVLPSQIHGVEGLMDYERQKHRPRRKAAPPASDEPLLTFAVPDDAKNGSITLTLGQARKLYAQLGALFARAGG